MDFWFSILTIMAIVIGPFIAIQITRWQDDWKEKKARRLWVLHTLMSTRNAILHPDHVRALNMIDLTFVSKNVGDKKVADAWKCYVDVLNKYPQRQESMPDHEWGALTTSWIERRNALFVELLHVMANVLGYDSFDKVHIKNNAYYPLAHENTEDDQRAVLFYLRKVLENNRAIPLCLADHLAKGDARKPENSETQGGE